MVHLKTLIHHPAARATAIIFGLCGFIFGTWASLIPFIKDTFRLDEAQLGLLLLCLPLGNLLSNPVSVLLISRWGAVRVSLFSIVWMAIGFALPVFVSEVWVLGVTLVMAGSGFAFTNVAMNTCASHLEQESKLQIMSACHGMWSLGAMLGSLISGLLILGLQTFLNNPNIAYPVYMILLMILVLGVSYAVAPGLRMIDADWVQEKKDDKPARSFLKPNRTLWILISICLCTFLTEGTMADWSAVYLHDVTHAPEAIAGWGFAVYAFFQAAGRFAGDLMISRHGAMQMLRSGGILVIAGLAIVILSGSPWITLPGFMLTGLGISLASPILYAAAAKVPDMPKGAGLATMNTFGMAAFLGGPVLVGFVAKWFDLRVAFMCVMCSALVWVLQTSWLLRRNHQSN